MSASEPHAAHGLGMREKWKEMSAAQRAEHIKLPTHLYKYLSSFVPRGTTEGRIGGFFLSMNHLGTFSEGSSSKFELSPSACKSICQKLNILILEQTQNEMPQTIDVRTLDIVMQIQRSVSEDFAAQGWSYNYAQHFAYRTPLDQGN